MPCIRKYKNLGEKRFGEQKYVTSDMLRQFCRNDAYLKREIERIEYLTPPAVRKRFTRIPVNPNESYGYMQNEDGTVNFDSATDKLYYFDFKDLQPIDENKTTAFLQSFLDNGEVIKQYTLPQHEECKTTIKRNTTRNYSPWTIYETDSNGNIIYEPEPEDWHGEPLKIPKIKSDDMTCNEFWYIGFDRNRHYETRPNWLQDQLNTEIPGISRAQTFKAKSSGVLKSVVFNLHGTDNTGSPLIVQIRKVVDVKVHNDETGVDEIIKYPVNSSFEKLAYQEVRFSNTDPGVFSVTFDNPCTVERGQTYAIVLLSPLSHSTNCYWVGGWNKHCHSDVYRDGDAFFSFNNGWTWIRYGKDTEESENVEYHAGKYAPQDFAFQCHIEEVDKNCVKKYATDKDYYVYLKPIYTNPIKSVLLSARDKGDTVGGSASITYQISNNGRDWVDIESNNSHTFQPDEDGEYRTVLFVRAKLRTSDFTQAPILQSLTLSVKTELPKEMYVRTYRYEPLTSGILSASVWGRLYAPFEAQEYTDCSVELISDKELKEHFIIIQPISLGVNDYSYIKGIDWSRIKNKTKNSIINYLTDNPRVIETLKESNIYVIGFFDSIKLNKSPAYPLISMFLQPSLTSKSTVIYGEGYDFHVSYGDDVIYFYDDVLEDMLEGTLSITYNPILIDGLTSSEVGIQYSEDNDGNLKVEGQGLILDYFQEEFTIGETEVETRRLSLKAVPVDPVRKVVIMKDIEDLDDEDNIILQEDIDYRVDYDNKEIEFLVNSSDGSSSVLEVGELIYVIYTPDFNENSLGIGYYATRTRTNKDVILKPNWIEYKA